jgi:hypothetical protein
MNNYKSDCNICKCFETKELCAGFRPELYGLQSVNIKFISETVIEIREII